MALGVRLLYDGRKMVKWLHFVHDLTIDGVLELVDHFDELAIEVLKLNHSLLKCKALATRLLILLLSLLEVLSFLF